MIYRAYYQAEISAFLKAVPSFILGELSRNHNFSLEISQKNAWTAQIENLQDQLKEGLDGQVFFEFSVPRMGKRVDIILYVDNVVFVLEYKVGAKKHDLHSQDQVLDYALDLKNFHEGSHQKYIVPVLISTKAEASDNKITWYKDGLCCPLLSNGDDLVSIVKFALKNIKTRLSAPNSAYEFFDGGQDNFRDGRWSESGYKPTPTIVEAAQALYQGNSVEEISRSDAGAKNLSITSSCITEIIDSSKRSGTKSICFVTGVPGAGKTLAGLNISTRELDKNSEEYIVFLSGNGPLVEVLREALARDEVRRLREQGQSVSKKEALQKVSSFIQNIHHFRDEGLKSNNPPYEHVVIFDEAQRAWDQSHAEKFMVQKRGLQSFSMSEPEFLISLMDRRQDWATIVCLIGGGQEINTGEAGLVEWFSALQKSFPAWKVYHSGQLTNKNYHWGEDLASKIANLKAIELPDLHLSVSIRSFRAEKLSDFIGAVIDGDASLAASIHKELSSYHMVLTRNLAESRSWLRRNARGTERLGLVASSGAMRLRPEGLHVKSKIDPANWFLNGKEDTRSSYYLEEVATEFDIQGLELDWAGVCWDADLRMENNQWSYYDFKGTKWQSINNSYRRVYLANAYRVLLTRARQGMVIFIPQGDSQDHTRPPRLRTHSLR
jgi:hypothetical protein